MQGVAPQLAVGKCPFLELPEGFHPLVRLAEEPQPEEADPDDEEGSSHEGDEQFDVNPGGQTGNRPDERIVSRTQPSTLRLHCCSVLLQHVSLRPALRSRARRCFRPSW